MSKTHADYMEIRNFVIAALTDGRLRKDQVRAVLDDFKADHIGQLKAEDFVKFKNDLYLQISINHKR